ncbi:tRNA1(Val) (adenine(37)-N6)-methyltransferase [Mycoplasma sp. 4013]
MNELENKLPKQNWIKNSLGFDSDLYVYQDKTMFNYSVDTILLGNFVFLSNHFTNALEIGTNNAALSIFIAARSEKLYIDAIEIQQQAIQLAKFNVTLNKLDKQINVINADFNLYWKQFNQQNQKKYQIIFCNPPFYRFDASKIRQDISKAKLIATHEITLNLDELILGCSKIIEQKGFLSLVLPVERCIDAFELLRKYNFEPKRIQFVHPRLQDKAKFVLIEARYQAGWGSHFLPNLYLHDAKDLNNHDYLPQIKQLYKPIKLNKE